MKKVLLTSVLVLFALCAFNLSAYAIGMGVYGIGRFGYVELPDADTSGSKFNGGAGFILDTAVASDTLFNYRMNLGIEYMETNYAVYDSIPVLIGGSYYPIELQSSDKATTTVFSVANTFGFGVVRTEKIRLWLGPQVTVGALLADIKGGYGELGLALGLNINFGEVFTLGFTVEGRSLIGAYAYLDGPVEFVYGGEGVVTMAFIFRINDTY